MILKKISKKKLKITTIQATPKASMLIESMRDIGYSLETALADIIDNSITAGASKIQIFSDIENLKIGVLDNGIGMNNDDLISAMRPGSSNPLDKRSISDLGRFGLGLKTSSFSQCRRLTVVTRHDNITNAAIWDLDFVAQTNDWLVQIPDNISQIQWVDKLTQDGTLIIWENLDRLIEHTNSTNTISYFNLRMAEACEHLELVFHRFLTGEKGLKKISIYINNSLLKPFDPFHSNHPATIHGPVEIIKVNDQEVIIQPFTLPHHCKVNGTDWERYAGRGGYLKNQGFYVYRGKRLIIYGTWFGLARQMELTKLARVKIDMQNEMDEKWKIDVKKSSAQPPYQVRERLRNIINEIGATSKRIYKSRGRKLTDDNRLPFWNRIQDKNEIIYRINHDHPVLLEFYTRLSEDLKKDFKSILELTSSSLPVDALFADFGDTPEKITGNVLERDALFYTITTTVNRLKDTVNNEGIQEMLSNTEPFRSNWQQTEEILNQLFTKEISLD